MGYLENKKRSEKILEIEKRKDNRYLSSTEITSSIIEYLNNHMRYAILLDGEWGSGKTYYVKNELIQFINSYIQKEHKYKGIIYISLYGIDSIEEIKNHLIFSILELNISKRNYKKFKNLIVKGTKIGIDALENGNSIFNTIQLFQNISKYILVFDDLERCLIPISQILGYLNEMVEHSYVKTIIVSNQREISKLNKYNNTELKYLVAIQNEIKDKDKNVTLDKKDIITKVNYLFEENELYDQIKEKLIGEVIYYYPNLSEIINHISEELTDEELKNIILYNKSKITEQMYVLSHINIRTLKIAILKYFSILKIIRKQKNDKDQVLKILLDNIFIYTLHVTIKYKQGKKLYNWKNLLGGYGAINIDFPYSEKDTILGFEFVDQIVSEGYIDEAFIKDTVSEYIKVYKKNLYVKGSAYDIISNFIFNTEGEIAEALKILHSEIKLNKHTFDIYERLLYYLFELKSINLEDEMVDKIIKQMDKNVKNYSSTERKHFIPITSMDRQNKEYDKIINNWEEISLNCAIKIQKEEIEAILKIDKDWGDNLLDYCKTNKYEHEANYIFMNCINIDMLILKLINSKQMDIINFRKALCTIYDFERRVKGQDKKEKHIREHYIKDLNNLNLLSNEIHDAIKEKKVGKIESYILEIVAIDIDEIIEILNKSSIPYGKS